MRIRECFAVMTVGLMMMASLCLAGDKDHLAGSSRESTTGSTSLVQTAIAASQRLRAEGRWDEAARIIMDAQVLEPDHPELELERLMIRQAQGKLTAPEREALAALMEEQAAVAELAIGEIRLSLVRAKARLAQGRWDDAERTALAALARLDDLPAGEDRQALSQSLTSLVETARQARQAARPSRNGTSGATTAALPMAPHDEDHDVSSVPRNSPPASYVAQTPAGETVPTIGLTVAQPYVRVPSLSSLRFDQESEAFQQVELLRQGVDPGIRSRIIIYPSNWQELTELRRPYRSGLLYRGPDVVGDDGVVRYTAVYDIADILADIPNFNLAPVLDLEASLQAHADRVALRQTSAIFTGEVRDLAAGIPLLGYFGGVDEHHVPPAGPGARYTYEDIERMVGYVVSAP